MDINEFKEMKVWAVVGSVHDSSKYAYKIFKNLRGKGYEVYAVDPKGIDVDGEKSYTKISELPVKPDAVDMVINPVKGMDYLEEAYSLGIANIWFQPGAESSELIEAAKNKNMNYIDNRCVMVEF